MPAATRVSGLVLTAVINIGLEVLFFALYSVFRKQPGNAGIYFARQVLKEKRKRGIKAAHFVLRNFLPSASWLKDAWSLSEDVLLENTGLDSVVFLRVFVFCFRFFGICTLLGLFVLLPVNYIEGQIDIDNIGNDTLDKFTISNVPNGSDRLWVHFGSLYFISFLAYGLLYSEYDYITKKRVDFLYAARPQPDQFSVLVRAIPSSRHQSYRKQVDDFFHTYYPDTYLLHQMLYEDGKFQKELDEAQWLLREVQYLRSIPASQRRQQKEGFLGLFGRKEDPLDFLIKRFEEVRQSVKVLQMDFIREKKELPVAFVSFKTRRSAAVAAQTKQTPNPLIWVTEWAPEPRDVNWSSLSAHYSRLWMVRLVIGVIFLCIVILFFIPVGLVYTLATLENLEKWFPFITSILSITLVGSIVNGYLPSLLLTIIYYFIPPLMLSLTEREGYPSHSCQERKACGKVFLFLVGNSFFVVTIGSLLTLISEAIESPRQIPGRLASAVSGQANFFMNFVMTKGWTGFAIEILQPYLLLIGYCWRHVGRKRHHGPHVQPLPYFKALPNLLLFIFIGFMYAILAPLMLPFLMVYFMLGYLVYRNQVFNKYEPAYETGGQYWPHVHNRVVFSIFLMQIVAVGMFGVKSNATASSLSIPLLVFTLLFQHYCNLRFLPVFRDISVQMTLTKDLEDEQKGLKEEILQELKTAYLFPHLKPLSINLPESSSHEPLLSNYPHASA